MLFLFLFVRVPLAGVFFVDFVYLFFCLFLFLCVVGWLFVVGFCFANLIRF